MKVCDITYAEALKRHPAEVKMICTRLARGKSKNKTAKPETLAWSYECAVRIEGSGTFADLLSGKMDADAARRDAMSLDAKVADEVRRTHTSLQASIGRWADSQKVQNPPEVEANIRRRLETQAREQAEFDALPEEEQERQREELLGQLRGTPGFVELHLEVPRRR
jgi:hypothetical protein